MIIIFFYILFFITLFFCLFILYLLSKNDFVLLRVNISLSEVFNIALGGILFSAFFSRLFFVLDIASWSLLSPLRFFHFIRIPGFSVFGFFLSFALWIYLRSQKPKATNKLFDIFFLAFSPLFIFSFLVPQFSGVFYFVQLGIMCMLFLLFILVFKFNKNFVFKDGSVALLIAFLISVNNFILQIFFGNNLSFSPSFYLSFIILSLSLSFFIYNQKLFFFKKK